MLEQFASLLGYVPACASSAFVCQAKDYIPDFIEPIIIPALETVTEHPYVSSGLSLLAAGGMLWRNYQYRNQYHAKASGYRNNCGLHTVINTWLSLTERQIYELAQNYPIFDEIVNKFYEFYQLPGQPNLHNFLQICRLYNHPLDREILLGQVFRRVLQDNIQQLIADRTLVAEEITNVYDDESIPDDLLSVLTKQMGAALTIHNTTHYQSVQQAVTYVPDEGPVLWNIQAYHVGGHYDFKFASYQQNVEHNTRRSNLRNSLLVQAATISSITQKDLALPDSTYKEQLLQEKSFNDIHLQEQSIAENVLAAYLQIATAPIQTHKKIF
ncbi:MAG: hypothetical protein HYX61_09100 [Gammaproteobacteria bacterium]|jgi:hypothetical protein|nr:hypothetical protein [Gammaproteobacteria bacterium]